MASPELTNTRAARVKSARRLANRSYRHEHRRFVVEGAQPVREALLGIHRGTVVHELFVRPDQDAGQAELVAEAERLGVRIITASQQVLSTISETVTPQGVLAVCDFVDQPLPALLSDGPRLLALLARVRDPGNAGSVVRAADAAGVDGVVFSTDSVDAYNGKVVRASVGGLFHLPISVGTPVLAAVDAARSAGLQVLAADTSGALDLDECERSGALARPTLWIFGNEANGLSDDELAAADSVVRIPIYGGAESLNLAAAATLCLYSSARAQRGDSRDAPTAHRVDKC